MLFAMLPDFFDGLVAGVFAGFTGVLASFSAGDVDLDIGVDIAVGVDGGVNGGVDVFFIMAILLILYKYTVFLKAP